MAVRISRLATFYGNAIVERRLDYASSGEVTNSTQSELDLVTQEPVRRSFMDRSPPEYLSALVLAKELGLGASRE